MYSVHVLLINNLFFNALLITFVVYVFFLWSLGDSNLNVLLLCTSTSILLCCMFFQHSNLSCNVYQITRCLNAWRLSFLGKIFYLRKKFRVARSLCSLAKLENCEVLQRYEKKEENQKNLGLADSDSAENILGTWLTSQIVQKGSDP